MLMPSEVLKKPLFVVCATTVCTKTAGTDTMPSRITASRVLTGFSSIVSAKAIRMVPGQFLIAGLCKHSRSHPSKSARRTKHPRQRNASTIKAWLRVEEWAVSVALPEIGQDDHACDRRIGTPQRGEGVALDLHYSQENRQVGRPKQYHHFDL